jgi:hypothetical protein
VRGAAGASERAHRTEAIPLLSRIIGIVVAILVVVWVVSTPAAAGDDVHGWISGILTFFQHVG